MSFSWNVKVRDVLSFKCTSCCFHIHLMKLLLAAVISYVFSLSFFPLDLFPIDDWLKALCLLLIGSKLCICFCNYWGWLSDGKHYYFQLFMCAVTQRKILRILPVGLLWDNLQAAVTSVETGINFIWSCNRRYLI